MAPRVRTSMYGYDEKKPKKFECITINDGNVQVGDRYYVVDGTRVEETGFAAALFPDLIETTSFWSEETTSRSVAYVAEQLTNQQCMFRNSVEKLLAGIASDEDVRLLQSDAGGWRWTGEALRAKIIDNLGEEATQILVVANRICKTLFELKKKLPDAETGDPARATQVIKSFYNGKPNQPGMKRLKESVNIFRKLTSDAIDLSPKKSKTFESLQKLNLVQQCAAGLYDALRCGWRCKCQDRHPANIELDVWSRALQGDNSLEKLKFSFLFADNATDARVHHWMTAEAVDSEASDSDSNSGLSNHFDLSTSPRSVDRIVSSPESEQSRFTPCERTITDLCHEINSIDSQRAGRRRVGSISDSSRRNSFVLSTKDQTLSAKLKRSVRLADAIKSTVVTGAPPHSLTSSWADLNNGHKVHLGLMLAWGVLQISSTGWLEGYWTRDDILLVIDSTNKPRPYVIHGFESSLESAHRDPDSSSPTRLSRCRPNEVSDYVTNIARFALAVFLIELAYDRPIEDLATKNEKYDGEVTGQTKFLTASRLANDIDGRLGFWYGQAVRACLTSGLKIGPTGRRLDASEFIHEEIIQPLEEAARAFEQPR